MLNVAHGREAAHHCSELDLAADNETRNHIKPVYDMSFKDTASQRLALQYTGGIGKIRRWY